MIELPEALTIAAQLTEALAGKRIVAGVRGNSPHKFAFYSGPPEYYAETLAGKTVGPAYAHGVCIIMPLEPGYLLGLGCGGERILWHREADTLPKKHQLLISFEDASHLSASISGWGAAWLLRQEELAAHPYLGKQGISPLSEAFTWDYFQGLFEALPSDDARAIKYFCISEPGILGMGNGCLQDVLLCARLHPRRRAAQVTESEQRVLYEALRQVLGQMVALGGRDSEYDLYNRSGRYQRLLHSNMVGQPCPQCGAPVEKTAFLGGACYYCPNCQK